jgi:hypothetical protein
MKNLRGIALGTLYVLILLASINAVLAERRVLNVPYVSQGGQPVCVSAAVTMILQYWGTEAELPDVVKKIGYPPITLDRIRHAVESYGLTFRYETLSNIERLKKWVDQGVPVMVHQVDSETVKEGHMRVVIGYDDGRKTIITHDSAHGAYYEMTYERFALLWKYLVKYVYPDNPHNETYIFKPRTPVTSVTLTTPRTSTVTPGSYATTTITTKTTTLPTTLQTTTMREGETEVSASTQLGAGVLTTEVTAIVGVAFILILTTAGTLYLRRRKK